MFGPLLLYQSCCGLDLNGGVLFVLDVDLDKAVDEQLVSAYQQAKSIIIKQKAHGLKVLQTGHGFEINALPNAVQKLNPVIDELQSRFANLAVTTTNNGNVRNAKFSYSVQGRSNFNKEVMSQTLATVASVVPDVISVRVKVLFMALLIILAGLSALLDLTRKSSRTLSPTIIESLSE